MSWASLLLLLLSIASRHCGAFLNQLVSVLSPSTTPEYISRIYYEAPELQKLRNSISLGVLEKIAKTGSLCCVAARPHGSNTASGDWSLGQQEPYWQTNTSYSPPPLRRDLHFQFEGLPYGLDVSGEHSGSSASSDSKGSRRWVRGNDLYNYQPFVSDAGSEISQAPQWTPPAIQEISVHHNASPASQSLSFAPALKEPSENPNRLGSSSSPSDSSESELGSRFRFPTQRNSSSRCLFIPKPVYPLSLPIKSPLRDASDIDHRLSNASSSVDLSFADASEHLESEMSSGLDNLSNDHRCRLCDRFLWQRSLWSSRRIVRSGDLPVAGVLSCHHAFHAECLDQTTSKMHKSDPPCPICAKMEDDNSPERRIHSRLRSNFPRLRTYSEDGPSRPWGCGQISDCVEGALHTPPRNSMVVFNRNRLKKNLSLKSASLSKEFPSKIKRNGPCLSSPFWVGSPVNQTETPKAAAVPSPRRSENL